MASMELVTKFLAEPLHIVVVGIRRDGRPHVTPNWFSWDGERFYVSTMRPRAKYRVFRNDRRAELLVSDGVRERYVLLPATVEVREDVENVLDQFRAIRTKYGKPVPPGDAELRAQLEGEERVLLVMTPDVPMSAWLTRGLDRPVQGSGGYPIS